MDRRSGNKRKIDKNRWRGGCDEECKKDPGKKTKDHSGISGHGLICFRSGMVSDEEGTCLSVISIVSIGGKLTLHVRTSLKAFFSLKKLSVSRALSSRKLMLEIVQLSPNVLNGT